MIGSDNIDVPVHIAAKDAELIDHKAHAVLGSNILIRFDVRLVDFGAVDHPVLAIGVGAVVQDDQGKWLAAVRVVHGVVGYHDHFPHGTVDHDRIHHGVAALRDLDLHFGGSLGQGDCRKQTLVMGISVL